MKLFSIEGNTQKLDGGAMFGNAPRVMWEKWIKPDDQNRIPLSCRALLLITDDDKKILFETGIGSFFEPKLKERYGVVESEHRLLKNLRNAGFSHGDIDTVVLSHLHFDHAGGLLSECKEGKEPELLFPNAKYYVGHKHWDRAIRPHFRDRASFVPKLNELLKNSERMVLVEDSGYTDLAPLITFRFSNGHTPGLMMSEIHLHSGPVVFVADLIPGRAWIHLPITMGYDRYPELLINEKKELLSDLVTKNGKIFFTHDSEVPCVGVKQDEKGKFFGEKIELQNLA